MSDTHVGSHISFLQHAIRNFEKKLRYFAACLGILCLGFTLIKDGSSVFLLSFFCFFTSFMLFF